LVSDGPGELAEAVGPVLAIAVAGQVLDECPLPLLVLELADGELAVVGANGAFHQLTGYRPAEVEGSAFRWLADAAAADLLRQALLAGGPAEIQAAVCRRDGPSLECSIALRPLRPLRDGQGAPVRFAAWLIERPAADVRDELLAQARAALAAAMAAEARAVLLAEATSDLAMSLDVAGSLQRLARLAVPSLADWLIIDLADETGRPVQVAMLHRDGHKDVVRRFSELQIRTLTAEAPIMRILAGEPSILHARASIQTAGSYVSDPELLRLCDELGICSAMYVPLAARGRVLGSMTLVAGRSGRIFTAQDLQFATDLGRRAALVVDNASLYEREHRVAQVLQESLLPRLPGVAGLELAARYRPSDRGAEVGGDFYDVLALPDGSTGLAVGDIVGHDIEAAAAMGQLRGLLRACAWELAADGDGDPGRVLTRLDRLVQALKVTGLATVFYARVEQRNPRAGPWTMRYSAAGHPSPLLRRPGGQVIDLDGARGAALGISAGTLGRTGTAELPVGSLLVAFTDGLVERRGEDWDTGMDRIRQVLARTPDDIPVPVLADRLVETAGPELRDDIAILVVRFR
jgi:serine phosphatase RsbU (regulator of sigma subunit)